jgi:hypothetical protein
MFGLIVVLLIMMASVKFILMENIKLLPADMLIIPHTAMKLPLFIIIVIDVFRILEYMIMNYLQEK